MRNRFLALTLLLLLIAAGCQQTAAPPSEEEETAPQEEAPAAEETDSRTARASELAGTWTGQWRNLTFGSSGSAAATVTVDESAGTFTIELDLGGSVFGESDPPPQSFGGNLSETTFNGTVDLLGAFTSVVDGEAETFTFEAPDVPSPRVNRVSGSGKVEGNTLAADIDITLSDGSTAKSVLELTKS